MDRFILGGMALSAAAHTLVIVHLPAFSAGPPSAHVPFEVEFRSFEAAEESVPKVLFQRDMPAPENPKGMGAEDERSRDGGDAARTLKGTGQILREIVNETLRPLLTSERRSSPAFVEAVNRYKMQLEEILERESVIPYPRRALESGREARIHIRFSLKSDGSLASVEAPQSPAGFSDVLVAGLKKAADRFPPFPEEITCPTLTFYWPVSFDLR